MKEIVFTGKIKEKEGNHYLGIYRRDELQKIYNSLELDTELEFVIRKKKVKRTLPQNSLIHVYFDIIAKEIGMDRKWVKDEMKKRFLTVNAKNIYGELLTNKETGEVLTRVKDTSELTKEEMMIFCEEVRIYVMDFSIYLEKPDEQGELKFTDL